jgi:hypothetical protein
MDIAADLLLPISIAFIAGAIAIFWPWVQTWHRGRKFERIVRRELQEIRPHPIDPTPDKP